MTYSVSIITSVLNGAKTIKQCLQSVSAQIPVAEHIVVDGGSTDGCREIVSDFSSNHIRLIDAPGTSISEALNIGVQCARGQIIGILNADDWYEHDAILKSFEVLQNNPEVDFTYGSVILCLNDGDILAQPVSATQIHRAVQEYMPFCHISSFVRKSVYETCGAYSTNYRVAMDFDFYARIFKAGCRGQQVDGVIGYAKGGGVSSNDQIRRKEYLEISSKHIGKYPAMVSMYTRALRSFLFRMTIVVPGLDTISTYMGVKKRFIKLS